MQYTIGVDIGTSSTKVILLNGSGDIVATSSESYETIQPKNGWAEQNPLNWKSAVLKSIKNVVHKANVDKNNILGIGLSGQMHGLVMLDNNGEPIGNSIIWSDQRTNKQVNQMLEIFPESKWLKITGNPPLAAWTAAKILWVRENEPEKYRDAQQFLLPKDYIRYILTGDFATDVSDASGMQLLDVKKRDWSEEVLNALNIDENKLGKVYESMEITGTLTQEIADYCGLNNNTIVVAGASDNASTAIGTGVINNGDAFTSLGTSAIVYTHLDEYIEIPNGSLHLCCSAVPGSYHTMGGPQSASLSLEWFKNNFCQNYEKEANDLNINVYSYLNQKVAQVSIGSDKLLFLPFLMGERTPQMEPKLRGAFIGLNTIHKQEHLLRAIMEGVGYSLADCNNILTELGVHLNSMKVSGGGAKSKQWLEILANLYEKEISVLRDQEGAGLGACILAGVATNIFEDFEDASHKVVNVENVISYDANNIMKYRRYHKLYQSLYHNLKEDLISLYDIE